MINLGCVKSYCKGDITKIENYDKAINDKTQTWTCHHRLEISPFSGKHITPAKLKELDMYFHRSPEELIFLTRGDHMLIHNQSPERNKHISESNKGKIFSEEHKKNIGIASKNKSKESFARSLAVLNTEEVRKKAAKTRKETMKLHPHRWWNNGVKETYQEFCPEGFVKGRLPGVLRRK